AEALEKLASVDTLVVDKTGTLTEGKPRLGVVTAVKGGPLSEQELLRLAASVEQASEHPLARAIVRGARERSVRTAEVANFKATFGGGGGGGCRRPPVVGWTSAFLPAAGRRRPPARPPGAQPGSPP